MSNRNRRCAALFAALAGLWTLPASASPVPFTWDLSSLGGSVFTADSISMTTYLYALAPPPGMGNAPETFIFEINGFSNAGTAVTPAGFGSAYGLYLTADVTVTPANQYTMLDLALKADPGNLDGAPSATVSGAQFANTGPTGAADDITLATGTIVAGSFGVQANGRPGAHFIETFAPAPGESGVILDPLGNHVQLEELLFNTATSRQVTNYPDGSVLTLVNGGISTADVLVPEPASIMVLGAGLLGLLTVRRHPPA